MGFSVTQHPGVIPAPVSNPLPTLLVEPINSSLAHLAGLWCSFDFDLSGSSFPEKVHTCVMHFPVLFTQYPFCLQILPKQSKFKVCCESNLINNLLNKGQKRKILPMFLCVGVLPARTVRVPPVWWVAMEVRRRCWSPKNWSNRWLWATMWILGTKLRSFGRAARGPNHWAISITCSGNRGSHQVPWEDWVLVYCHCRYVFFLTLVSYSAITHSQSAWEGLRSYRAWWHGKLSPCLKFMVWELMCTAAHAGSQGPHDLFHT